MFKYRKQVANSSRQRERKVFLNNPQIPLDNNLAKQAIRPSRVEKKNWKLLDTFHGDQASAILETSKANDLNIYNYFKHFRVCEIISVKYPSMVI